MRRKWSFVSATESEKMTWNSDDLIKNLVEMNHQAGNAFKFPRYL